MALLVPARNRAPDPEPRLKIGLIGFGAIGQFIASHLRPARNREPCLTAVCVRTHQLAEAREQLGPATEVTDDFERFVRCKVDMVVEAAGHGAICDYAERVVGAGRELFALSIGALADERLRARLERAARANGGAVSVPAGALGAFDGLLAMRQSGLTSVTYTSTKPPAAWLGTAAEAQYSLSTLTDSTVIFRGSAAEAAAQFPKNANLAAAVALAGIGFESTEVVLVADPAATGNTGHLRAQSRTATLDFKLSTRAFAHNPKTSEITALSVLAALENRQAAIRFI